MDCALESAVLCQRMRICMDLFYADSWRMIVWYIVRMIQQTVFQVASSSLGFKILLALPDCRLQLSQEDWEVLLFNTVRSVRNTDFFSASYCTVRHFNTLHGGCISNVHNHGTCPHAEDHQLLQDWCLSRIHTGMRGPARNVQGCARLEGKKRPVNVWESPNGGRR